jgi:transcriptional regulator with XRE-family HTH domain
LTFVLRSGRAAVGTEDRGRRWAGATHAMPTVLPHFGLPVRAARAYDRRTMGEGDRSVFAGHLRRLREAAGVTQEELAERAGLTAKGISALERGDRRRPYPATVRALADALDLSSDERTALIAAIPSRSVPEDRAVPAPPTTQSFSWPPETSPLVGREEEVDVLRDQLLQPDVRLVTIIGPGGVGKTRLATTVARSLIGDAAFADGVWFADLSAATTPTAAVSILSRTLKVTEGSATASLAGLEAFVAARRLLLVLDNL